LGFASSPHRLAVPAFLEPAQMPQLRARLLAISGMGLRGCNKGFVIIMAPRDKRLLEMLKIPHDHELFGVLTVGYPKVNLIRWAERNEPQITWV
jgi:hypothetical protein